MRLTNEQLTDKLVDRCCHIGTDDHGHTDCWLFGLAAEAIHELQLELMALQTDLAVARGEM